MDTSLQINHEEQLASAIRSFIEAPQSSGTTFTGLALDLFAYQYDRSVPYRTLCDSLGINPAIVTRIEEIPAVPAEAFKLFELSCVGLDSIERVFYSSGTTGSDRSTHNMSRGALDIYRISLTRGFKSYFPVDTEIWALAEPADRAVNSSLSYMLQELNAARWFWDDRDSLAQALTERNERVTVFGTAFAWVDLLDNTSTRWQLPAGSRIIETGGFKGRTREVPRDELYAMFRDRFGVADDHCHSEYGMSEMASQFYSTGENGVLLAPHWLRTIVISPETGMEAADGDIGLLRHIDLANLNSAMVLQTEDLGMLVDGGIRLFGRAKGSEIRGCSLSVEELWKEAK
jgi:hypothetical protein